MYYCCTRGGTCGPWIPVSRVNEILGDAVGERIKEIGEAREIEGEKQGEAWPAECWEVASISAVGR